eukprot:TRINITY_DN2658_c0_g1_i1.p1 TRINITY_DN2658_c0_g1~~TRINITY_DN2658_c0_g1_i1.p1  ORF type:complete len:575 (+),score=117.36 TRINITY_DN2658_c0_g1_i1:83-1726(+)
MSPMASVSRKFLSTISLLAFQVAAQNSGKFLDVRSMKALARGPADLLAELESEEHVTDFDHVQMTTLRTERLEAALRPLYNIAPKDGTGNVDANAARYLLHRLFANRHGWFVNGLELHQGFVNTSNVGQALFGSGNSFSLHQLARFAASLETLVHAENIERLQQVFTMFGYSRKTAHSAKDAHIVIENYMILFLTIAMPDHVYTYEDKRSFCVDTLPEWNDTVEFAEEVRRNVLEASEGETFSLWEHTLNVVEEIGERYGRWQNKGCLRLKSKLMQLETPGTGRVPLKSFWYGYVEDRLWPFRETLPLLEQLGALDGEAPYQSVMIPNYLYSASNCLAGSKYYDVCCINECESLLGEIESLVDAPTAPPSRLAQIVAKLPSSTVEAPGVLPSTLVERLNGIAAQHGGVVPLHGRLFQQFLAHAYPRECPFPRLSISKPHESDNWIKRFDGESEISVDMILELEEDNYFADHDDVDAFSELPWTDEEEFFMQSLSLDSADDGATGVTNVRLLVGAVMLAVIMMSFRLHQPLAQVLGLSEKGSAAAYHV